MDVVAAGTCNLAEMRGVGIGLIVRGFRGDLRVGAVTFDARRLICRL